MTPKGEIMYRHQEPSQAQIEHEYAQLGIPIALDEMEATMDVFAEVTIIFKGDPYQMDEHFSDMESAVHKATEAVENTLRGQLDQLGRAGLKPYLIEDSMGNEIEITA